MKKRIIALMTVLLILTLSACGGSSANDEDAFIGTWNIFSFEGGGSFYDAASLESMGVTGTLVIKDDHTMTISITGYDDSQAEWELKDKTTITVKEPMATTEIYLKDGKLVMETDAEIVTFSK